MKTNRLKATIRYCYLLVVMSVFAVSCKKNKDSGKLPDDFVNYAVSLNSTQETPSNSSLATGTLSAKYDKNSNTLSYTINFSGITPTAMHFHKGPVGVSGPVQQEIVGPYTSGMMSAMKLTDEQEVDLLAGLWYLNIHTVANPGGEIRAQVLTDNMVVMSNVKLNTKEEVPQKGTDASAIFNGVYDKTTKKVTYSIMLTNLTASAMHIHKGEVGVSGPVIVELDANGGTTAALTAEQETDLLAGNYYVNVLTAANPGGEIRGQLATSNQVVFAGALSSANEVPANVSIASGSFYSVYDINLKKLSYTLNYAGIVPTAMHFHKAMVGVNGAVQIEIVGPYSSGMKGSVVLTAAQEADLFGGMWYVNVHSLTYPGGEIRAQLTK
ncbi:MAG: hypothetical protein JWN56_2399 [Sphingobacteriales bacterium]|nr:hypothetical protein [Sphingobacteriales bacterium]